jgi:L-2-hydroxyglutarate oxidase LhgO
MDAVDAIVIGAGVVGLAVGRALAQQGLETLVIERAEAIGTATSSRNSEVIHAGLYYPSGSLKAQLCVSGRELLYRFCESHGVAHRRCGKLLVANGEAQRVKLREIAAQADANGVHDLQWVSGAQALQLEPALRADEALLSPSTGIVDSHGLMLALQGDLERAGGAVALLSRVEAIRSGPAQHVVRVASDNETTELAAGVVVNAAGLWAVEVARTIERLPPDRLPTPRFAKGHYFSLSGRSPFSRLVYPMPEEGGLGVHLTLDLAGQARFGPDVEWLSATSAEALSYAVDPARAAAFERSVRHYWPQLPDHALQPAYAGIRPKLEGGTDFIVDGPRAHGIPGLVNLFGIESPGLTACLALADRVVACLQPGTSEAPSS